MIELRRLAAFVAVAEEGHVTRAADRLGMAQPPLTRLIRGLEIALGTPLLRRHPKGVVPTAAGIALLEEARAVLARAAAVEETVRRAARGEQGRLAVGFTPSAALHPFVPDVLRRFRANRPGVQLVLDEAGTMELVAALQAGGLDAAFIRSPVIGTAGLVVDTLLEEPMVAALPAAHPLAGESEVTLASLAAEPFVLYRRPAGPGLHDAIVAACQRAGFAPLVAQEAPRLPATLSLVAAGTGITLVPASMRRMGWDGVVFRPLGDAVGLVAPLHLAMRRDGMGPIVAAFRTLVARAPYRSAAA